MTYQDFKEQYTEQFKQTVTYRNAAGETVKGLLISVAFHGLPGSKGRPYVNVDNWNIAIPLDDVIAIKTTATPW